MTGDVVNALTTDVAAKIGELLAIHIASANNSLIIFC